MRKLVALLTMLFVLAIGASAYSVDLHGDDGCYADGPHYAGNLNGWGVPGMLGGNYGGQGYDTFCLIVEPEMCEENEGVFAVFDVYDEAQDLNMLEVKYLDGISGADSFTLTLIDPLDNEYFIGTVTAEEAGEEDWMTEEFALPMTIPAGETWTIQFEAHGPIWDLCPDWGQVAIDYVDLWYDPEIPELGLVAGVLAATGALAGFLILRKR